MKKERDILLLAAIFIILVLLDIAVLLLLFGSGIVDLSHVLYQNIPLAVLLTIVSLLVMNVQLILIPIIKDKYVAPTIISAVAVTCVYFFIQTLLTFLSVYFLPVIYLIASLVLLSLYVLSWVMVFWVSGHAQNWGRNRS